MINKALKIAISAHANQVDKGNQPYIYHPIRVALNCKTTDEKIAALLHDVVEDTPWTFERLGKEGFSKEVVDAVRCLTKKENEEYMDFIKRLADNPIARNVKIQDLTDNMDTTRLNGKKHWKYDTYKEALDYLNNIAD